MKNLIVEFFKKLIVIYDYITFTITIHYCLC